MPLPGGETSPGGLGRFQLAKAFIPSHSTVGKISISFDSFLFVLLFIYSFHMSAHVCLHLLVHVLKDKQSSHPGPRQQARQFRGQLFASD